MTGSCDRGRAMDRRRAVDELDCGGPDGGRYLTCVAARCAGGGRACSGMGGSGVGRDLSIVGLEWSESDRTGLERGARCGVAGADRAVVDARVRCGGAAVRVAGVKRSRGGCVVRRSDETLLVSDPTGQCVDSDGSSADAFVRCADAARGVGGLPWRPRGAEWSGSDVRCCSSGEHVHSGGERGSASGERCSTSGSEWSACGTR